MPGIGVLLGAEFLAATGGDMSMFASADHLAGYAGLAPVPRDSGRISGNRHRPRRYNRDLNRVFYTSALISVRYSGESRTFHDRKAGRPGPTQPRRGKAPHPSRPRPRPQARQRLVGLDPGPAPLRTHAPVCQGRVEGRNRLPTPTFATAPRRPPVRPAPPVTPGGRVSASARGVRGGGAPLPRRRRSPPPRTAVSYHASTPTR
jgi:hypothetical protein